MEVGGAFSNHSCFTTFWEWSGCAGDWRWGLWVLLAVPLGASRGLLELLLEFNIRRQGCPEGITVWCSVGLRRGVSCGLLAKCVRCLLDQLAVGPHGRIVWGDGGTFPNPEVVFEALRRAWVWRASGGVSLGASCWPLGVALSGARWALLALCPSTGAQEGTGIHQKAQGASGSFKRHRPRSTRPPQEPQQVSMATKFC